MSAPQSNDRRNPLTVLRDARAHIERGWCRHALARDSQGNMIGSEEHGAVSWCAVGAVGAALGLRHPSGSSIGNGCIEALGAVVKNHDGFWTADNLGKIVDFNNADSTYQDDVLRLFDEAIESQRGYDFASFCAATLTALLETPRE